LHKKSDSGNGSPRRWGWGIPLKKTIRHPNRPYSEQTPCKQSIEKIWKNLRESIRKSDAEIHARHTSRSAEK
jgi:hypothetical protein